MTSRGQTIAPKRTDKLKRKLEKKRPQNLNPSVVFNIIYVHE